MGQEPTGFDEIWVALFEWNYCSGESLFIRNSWKAKRQHLLTFIILQVLNLTEIELNRVDIRVGLSGGLYFMDGSPQAVRQLRNLNSQVRPCPETVMLIYQVQFPPSWVCFSCR